MKQIRSKAALVKLQMNRWGEGLRQRNLTVCEPALGYLCDTLELW